MGRQERFEAAKQRTRTASEVQELARRFHETGSDEKAKGVYDRLAELAGGERQAEKAIRDAGGPGATMLRRLLGR